MKLTSQKYEFSYGFEVEPKGLSRPLIDQIHGDETVWAERVQGVPPADGIATRQVGRTIYVFTADCVPVLFFSDETGAAAAVHSGWRGAMQGIVQKALREPAWKTPFVVIGPHIGKCCFEVQKDFVAAFEAAGRVCAPYLETRGVRTYFDLTLFLIEQELFSIPRSRIDLSPADCTFCSAHQYPSYRRDGAARYRIKSWVSLQKRN